MKKLNKLVAILVAMAMVLSLSIIAAFAAPNTTGTDATNPAKAALTKTFTMQAGTTTPTTSFTFNFAPAEGSDTGATAFTKTINYTEAKTGVTSGDTKTVVIQSADILNGITWPGTGRFIYDVTEANAGQTASLAGGTLSYGTNMYKMYVDVKRDTTGALYVSNIAVAVAEYQTVTDPETGTETQKIVATETKVDPSNPVTPADGTEEHNTGNGFNFNNSFKKDVIEVTPTGEDDNDGKGFFVEKKVAGNLADTQQAFTFTVKVTRAAGSTLEKYTAAIYDNDQTGDPAADIGVVGQPIDFTFEDGVAEKTVTLTDNQRLVFTKTEVGAKYEVAETPDADYNTTVVKTVKSVAGEETTTLEAVDYITDGLDNAKYKNTYNKDDGTTPTGILISNLPYIALALVAIGGLVAYVVVRRRSTDEA